MVVIINYYYVGCKYKATTWYLKKNQNETRPSEHPLVRGGGETLRWDTRLQIQNLQIRNLFVAFKRVRSPMEITLGQQYNAGEKPTVILYTDTIKRHARTPKKR